MLIDSLHILGSQGAAYLSRAPQRESHLGKGSSDKCLPRVMAAATGLHVLKILYNQPARA